MQKKSPRNSKRNLGSAKNNAAVGGTARPGAKNDGDVVIRIPASLVSKVLAPIGKATAGAIVAFKKAVPHAVTALVTTLLLPHIPPAYAALLNNTHTRVVNAEVQVKPATGQDASAPRK